MTEYCDRKDPEEWSHKIEKRRALVSMGHEILRDLHFNPLDYF
jgi:hypothetical protein